jgi:hypothetical protein
MHLKFKTVKSSNIDGYLYLPSQDILLLTFKSGMTYAFPSVGRSVVTGFEQAHSKGVFFNRCIKNRYRAAKLDEAALEALLKNESSPPLRKISGVKLDSFLHRHPMLRTMF